ncbi:MAG: hypothetical protein ACI8UP_004290, partial [Porticoccaceae bacterium]|jgi:hypothetical protein
MRAKGALRFGFAPAVLLGLPVAMSTWATEYSLNYNVISKYEFNDNIRLSNADEINISGGTLSLPATLTMRTERLNTSLLGELASAKYNESGYDSSYQNLQANATYGFESGELSGYSGYKRDSTMSSEFLDTGIVGLTALRQDSASAGVSGFHMFNEQNGLSAGASYSDIDYTSTRLQNYEYTTAYAGWLHHWSERTQLRLQAYGNRYESGNIIEVESDSLGVQAGFDSQFSERFSVSLLAGLINVDTDYSTDLVLATPEDENTDTYLIKGSLNYRLERHEFSTNVNSSTSPSGDGYLLKNDQMDVNYRHRVSERSRFDLDLLAGRNGSLASRINNDRDYARLKLSLNYRFSSTWYIAGSYARSYQDSERADSKAESNAVYASLVYQPDKYVWSR